MIEIENTKVQGMSAAIRGARNPMNSWDKSDSYHHGFDLKDFTVGKNDLALMKKLSKAGPDHAKFRRMIVVYADITAPLYWWKEYDTYKVGTVANSCSTMHTIADKEFTKNDFSYENLIQDNYMDEHVCIDVCKKWGYYDDEDSGPIYPVELLDLTIDFLNKAREKYIETGDKLYWWQMIQLLPTSYNQKRTVMLNYEVLSNIYKQRRHHKLDEWRAFCLWIETLPYAEGIIFPEMSENEKLAAAITFGDGSDYPNLNDEISASDDAAYAAEHIFDRPVILNGDDAE